jgi:DNA photolyase
LLWCWCFRAHVKPETCLHFGSPIRTDYSNYHTAKRSCYANHHSRYFDGHARLDSECEATIDLRVKSKPFVVLVTRTSPAGIILLSLRPVVVAIRKTVSGNKRSTTCTCLSAYPAPVQAQMPQHSGDSQMLAQRKWHATPHRYCLLSAWVSSAPLWRPSKAQAHAQRFKSFASFRSRTGFLGTASARLASFHSTYPYAHQRSKRVAIVASSVTAFDEVVERSVVWFRVGDLRLRDHVGLTRAMMNTRKSIIPLFVVTPSTPAAVFPVLDAMRVGLRARKADLVVRFAKSEVDGVAAFCCEQTGGVDAIHVRCDADELSREAARCVEAMLDASGCRVVRWRDPFRAAFASQSPSSSATTMLADMPDVYPKFVKWAPRAKSPVTTSTVQYEPAVLVPGLPGGDAAPEPGALDAIRTQYDACLRPDCLNFILDKLNADSARVGVVCRAEDDGEAQLIDLLERMEAYEDVDLGRQLQPVFWLGLVSPR